MLPLWRRGPLRGPVSGKRARPLVKRGSLVGAYQLDSSNRRQTCLPVTLAWAGRSRKTSALLDSGAEESFMDATVATKWGVPLVEVSKPLVASSLNVQRLGRITQATRPLTMRISGNHQEDHRHPTFPRRLGTPLDGQASAEGRLGSARDPGVGPLVFEPLPEEGTRPRVHSSEGGTSEPG